MTVSLNGRPVEDLEIDGLNPSDHPKYCDAFISRAVWGDTGEELNDSELDALTHDSDIVYSLVMRKIYG